MIAFKCCLIAITLSEKELAGSHKKDDDVQGGGYTDTESGENKNAGTANPNKSWHRVLLLVIAITVHNFPEGMAVGVGFGGIGKTPGATFGKARSLVYSM